MLDYIVVILGGALGTGARFWVRRGSLDNDQQGFCSAHAFGI
jgi:fluoride ion exporter CrcB/FEX